MPVTPRPEDIYRIRAVETLACVELAGDCDFSSAIGIDGVEDFGGIKPCPDFNMAERAPATTHNELSRGFDFAWIENQLLIGVNLVDRDIPR